MILILMSYVYGYIPKLRKNGIFDFHDLTNLFLFMSILTFGVLNHQFKLLKSDVRDLQAVLVVHSFFYEHMANQAHEGSFFSKKLST